MRHLLSIAIFFTALAATAQNKYYVNASGSGSDRNPGTIDKPWKTVQATNNFNFDPGDSLFFAGGQTFGQLQLQNNDAGLTVTSYNGVATLGGMYAYNVGDITVSAINFYGPGTTGNTLDGVKFYMDSLSGGDLNNLAFRNINITNFGGNGLSIGAWTTNDGFNHVEVSNSNLYFNGIDGFASYGYNDFINNTDLHIFNVKSYQNYGHLDITTNRTGSGFTIGGFDGGLIENSQAYQNGKNNRNSSNNKGGPQGFWCYNSRNLTFQNNISHDNNAGLYNDGSGFDIDGGSSYCTIQYCYSYNNDGPGFAFFEHGSANVFTNNTIRYNISQNDARRNKEGGLMMWAVDTLHRIRNSQMYNNTIYVTTSATAAAGYPAGMYFLNSNVYNVSLFNNIIFTTDTVRILAGTSTNMTFSNNIYYTPGHTVNFTKGGVVKDPLFVNTGGGSSGYVLRGPSSAIDAGKVTTDTRDFIGTAVPQNSGYDIGAYESKLKPPVANAGTDQTTTLPANSVTLDGSGSYDPDGTIAGYSWTQTFGPSTFLINSPSAASTTVSNLVQGTYTFRLTVTDNDGISQSDDVQVVVNPVAGSKVINVNVYGGTNPYNNAAWNNWNVSASRTVSSLKYSDGTTSTAGASLSSSSGVSDNGSTYGGVMVAPEVLRYTSYYTSSRTLIVSGLSTTKSYNLELYASRNNTGNSTTFWIGSNSATVVTDANKTMAANLYNLKTNTSGSLVLNIDKTGSYNFLNGFVLTENPGTVTATTAPKANAGADQTITLPTSTATLSGSGSDADGYIFKYVWTKTAGPSQYTINTPNSATTTVSNLAQGTYTFRLTVTDNDGLTSYDNVVVYVNAAIPAGVEYVNVNVYGGSNAYTNTAWNNWNVSASKTITGLKYSDATTSSVTTTISASSSISDNGSSYGGTMCPPEVLRYTSYYGSLRTLTIGGLSSSYTYSLSLFASRNSTGNSTVFTINSTSVTIVTDVNKTNAATFTGLVPNSSGQIVVSINKVGTYNFLNGFTLTQNSSTASITRARSYSATDNDAALGGLQAQAYPNPAENYFTLHVKGSTSQAVQILVTDELGRIVDKKEVAPNSNVVVGEAYQAGVYYVAVIQGNRRTVLKLVKQGPK